MQERHKNREQYFREQASTSSRFVIPFISDFVNVEPGLKVLEIGCGEGGNILPFVDAGCIVYGIDLAANKISNGEKFFENHPMKANLRLIADDIYKVPHNEELLFDLIIMRDTLEHIPDQDHFLSYVKAFMKEDGKLFLAFPPWRMPFGGHQQVCRSKIGSKLPYFHLLPRSMYKRVLKLMGESDGVIEELMEVRDTAINMQWFHKIVKKHSFKTEKETYFLINPNYEVKFGLKTRKLPGILNIPFLRDFFCTTYYCVLSKHITEQ